ncbi:Crp/Fnr family transcriptional regulator [Lewinella sp. 4G2]|uniref:Crp/Fnr family transcriptional regulator n=1 Tax=Lewinella sp. 4G2 TaxID=1803372 RepID=UPI0007B4856F|nr:Crp/Fnr family transcriptional regulator [Lewinella sp. 4G2]OAV43461.1 Crp/Fnr family transcriptional regulator [Lewinella sp. 4G2]
MPSPLQQLKDYLREEEMWEGRTTLKRGDFLHQPGDRNDTIYLVETGTIQVYVVTNGGEEQIIRFAYPGDVYSAIDCLLTGRPTILSARAIRACTLLSLPGRMYRERILGNPKAAQLWQQVSAWMLVGQLDREIDLLIKNPAERYRRVLERSPQLFQEIPARYIANYLRMTPETLSHIRSQA